MRKIQLLLLLSTLLPTFQSRATVVAGTDTGEPLPMASIFSQAGAMIGMTSADGTVPQLNASFPLRVKYIGYEDALIDEASADTLWMAPVAYPLSEITVNTAERPLTYLRGYMREYNSAISGSDSIIIFTEHTVDFLVIPDSVKVKKLKGWKTPRTLEKRIYARISNSQGLDTVTTKIDDGLLSWTDLVAIVDNLPVPERIRNGQPGTTDSVPGKYSLEWTWHKTPSALSLSYDMLASYKGHRYSPWLFKLLGCTIDCTTLQSGMIFSDAGASKVEASDLQSISFTMEMTGKGKIIKKVFRATKPVDMHSYLEIYITDRCRLTPDEAREIAKNPPLGDGSGINPPENIPSLDTPTQRLIARVNSTMTPPEP